MKILSIIIPTYKRPELLRRCLLSIMSSSNNSFEIIVIDDDHEMSASSIAAEFDNVKYYCKRGNSRGLSKSRNIGIMLTEGKYILFIDDDDYLRPGSINILLNSISLNYNFYYCDFTYYYSNSKSEFVDQSDVTQNKQLVVNSIPVGSFIIERCSIRQIFDESMRSHEDWDFLLKNIDWNLAKHIKNDLIVIDKSHNSEASMQLRRRSIFGADFLSIYSRNPAPELNNVRREVLTRFNITVPSDLLSFDDVI